MSNRLSRLLKPADQASTAVVLAVAVAHVRFVVLDTRIPPDMGLYFRSLPDTFAALSALSTWPQALGTALEPGGWYVLLLAVMLRIFGRLPEVVQLVDGGWLVLALVMGALSGRKLAGSSGGLIAVALLGAPYMIVSQARTSWIHIPELALLLTALYALLSDQELRKPAWAVLAGVSTGLAIALRPSALVWAITLLPLLLPAWKVHRGRVIALVLATSTSALVLLPSLVQYLQAKVEARPRYETQVPGLLVQIQSVTGLLFLGLTLVGAYLAWRHLRREHAMVLGAWILTPLALVVVFLAGLDNFPFFAAGLALAASVGLARQPWGLPAAGALFLVLHLPQYSGAPRVLHGVWYAITAQAPVTGAQDLAQPHDLLDGQIVIDLVRSTCDPLRSCTVAVDQGLFRPYSEGPGQHELFLKRRDEVHIISLSSGDVPAHVDALATWECGREDAAWRQRYPRSAEAVNAVIQQSRLQSAWQAELLPGCGYQWMTPGGRVPRPELLPEPPATQEHRPKGPPPEGGAPAPRRAQPEDKPPLEGPPDVPAKDPAEALEAHRVRPGHSKER